MSRGLFEGMKTPLPPEGLRSRVLARVHTMPRKPAPFFDRLLENRAARWSWAASVLLLVVAQWWLASTPARIETPEAKQLPSAFSHQPTWALTTDHDPSLTPLVRRLEWDQEDQEHGRSAKLGDLELRRRPFTG